MSTHGYETHTTRLTPKDTPPTTPEEDTVASTRALERDGIHADVAEDVEVLDDADILAELVADEG